MKTYLKKGFACLSGIVLAVCLWSCDKNFTDQSDVQIEEHQLELIAPNGLKISQDIHTFKDETARVLKDGYGIKQDFEIINLEYLPVSTGYAVLIEYRTTDGLSSSFLRSNSTSIDISAHKIAKITSIRPRLKNSNENSGSTGWSIRCVDAGNCTGCYLTGVINPTGTITSKCSCTDCLMEYVYW
jgi:hypothetical protein